MRPKNNFVPEGIFNFPRKIAFRKKQLTLPHTPRQQQKKILSIKNLQWAINIDLSYRY